MTLTATSLPEETRSILEAGLSPGSLILDPDLLASYSTDEASFCPAGRAAALVRVADTSDVVHVLREIGRAHV